MSTTPRTDKEWAYYVEQNMTDAGQAFARGLEIELQQSTAYVRELLEANERLLQRAEKAEAGNAELKRRLESFSFWSSVYPEGMTLQDVQNELHDFHVMMNNVPRVYEHVANLCKPLTDASVIIAAYDENLRRDCEEAVKEETQELQAERDQLKAQLEEARMDSERLDWLCTANHWFDEPCDGNWTPESFRAAIDAAKEGGK